MLSSIRLAKLYSFFIKRNLKMKTFTTFIDYSIQIFFIIQSYDAMYVH